MCEGKGAVRLDICRLSSFSVWRRLLHGTQICAYTCTLSATLSDACKEQSCCANQSDTSSCTLSLALLGEQQRLCIWASLGVVGEATVLLYIAQNGATQAAALLCPAMCQPRLAHTIKAEPTSSCSVKLYSNHTFPCFQARVQKSLLCPQSCADHAF
eukprot:scaffold179412_cov22-Tisochrysis_lutea.AAC.1